MRVGAASPTAFVSVTNQATTPPQAALNASISGNAPITASGSFNLLDPGATNNNALQVGMNTATAGAINGTATIAFVSDASNVGGCSPNCQFNLPDQNVTVTGGVYQVAQPDAPRRCESRQFPAGQRAKPGAHDRQHRHLAGWLPEGLDASVGGTSGKATATGGPSPTYAQGGTNNAMSVGIKTAPPPRVPTRACVTINLASRRQHDVGAVRAAI